MSKESASRQVTNEDVALLDKAIADHELLQKNLYVLRRMLGEVGKVDAKRADLNRGVEAEQQRLDDVRKQADAAQERLTGLGKQIEAKQRELAAVETTIAERTTAANQLNESYLNLRNILAAA
jgi:predicted  nucleic acid-binding Zn-ribbon protein